MHKQTVYISQILIFIYLILILAKILDLQLEVYIPSNLIHIIIMQNTSFATGQKEYVVVSTRQFLGIQFYHYEGQQGTVHFNLGSKIIYGTFTKKSLQEINQRTTTGVVFEFVGVKDTQNRVTKLLKDSLKLVSPPENLKNLEKLEKLTGYLSMEEKKGFRHRSHLFLVRSQPPKDLVYYGTIKMMDILEKCVDCFLIYQSQRPETIVKKIPPTQNDSSSQSDNQKQKPKKPKTNKGKPQFKLQQRTVQKRKFVYSEPVVQLLADFRIKQVNFTKRVQNDPK